MDPVTHTLIGAGMAQAFFRRRVGPQAVWILALASNLPDVDGLVHLSSDPLAITLRRGFGHSLFALPVWSAVLAYLLKRKYPQIRLGVLFGLCLLGAGVHVFFDLVNSFGVRLLWPLSPWRPELAIVFIIDLALTGLLLAPFLACLPKAGRKSLPGACRLSLVCVCAYVLLCAANRSMAEIALMQEARGFKPDFAYVFPEPLGPQRWRGVLRREGLYQVYLIHSLSGRSELKAEVATAVGDPQVERVRQTPAARRLEAFFKAPVWSVRPQADGSLAVSVYDLRFRSLVIDRGRSFEFVFRLKADGTVESL